MTMAGIDTAASSVRDRYLRYIGPTLAKNEEIVMACLPLLNGLADCGAPKRETLSATDLSAHLQEMLPGIDLRVHEAMAHITTRFANDMLAVPSRAPRVWRAPTPVSSPLQARQFSAATKAERLFGAYHDWCERHVEVRLGANVEAGEVLLSAVLRGGRLSIDTLQALTSSAFRCCDAFVPDLDSAEHAVVDPITSLLARSWRRRHGAANRPLGEPWRLIGSFLVALKKSAPELEIPRSFGSLRRWVHALLALRVPNLLVRAGPTRLNSFSRFVRWNSCSGLRSHG